MSNRRVRPCARALFKFEGQADHELSFSPGESILLLRRIDENWVEGELNGKVGIFPNNHVRIELGSPSLSHESTLARSGKPCGIALYTFPGTAAGDLALEKGELVELLKNVGGGWLRGRAGDRVGIFPASFVETFTSLPDGTPTPKPRQMSTPDINSEFPKPKPRVRQTVPRHRRQTAPVISSGLQHREIAQSRSTSDTTPPLTRPRTKRDSVTNLESQLSSLESNLEVEEKMLKSARSLLKVIPTQEKKTKLSAKIAMHAENVESLQKQINQIEAQRNELLQSQAATVPVTPPTPQCLAPSKQLSTAAQCKMALNELVTTEGAYHHEIAAFCSKVLPDFKEWTDIKWEIIFSNLEELVTVSGELNAALIKARECQEKEDVEGSRVGEVFQTFAPKLRDSYAQYCRNHDQACVILEKWAEDSSKTEKVKELMDKGRPDVTSWDLQTLLIKPIQRILKYPLLLDKLHQLTPKDDVDYKSLSAAVITIGKVAQDINELKRRKDLVERYTGAGRDEKHINMNTLRKKVRRFQQTITQMTGLRSATVDPVFTELEQRVVSLETCLRSFRDNLESWQERIEHAYSCKQSLLDAMQLYSKDSQPVKTAEQTLATTKETWRKHCHQLHDSVLDPLHTLISLFNDPLLLIHKRKDKLLDYDSLQHDLEKANEPDRIQQLREKCELAKRNYEALNAQLLEELPLFCERVAQAASHLLMEFVHVQLSYHRAIVSDFDTSSITCNGLETQYDNEEDYRTSEYQTAQQITASLSSSLAAVSQNLSQLSIVPVSLSTSFTVRQLNKMDATSETMSQPPIENVASSLTSTTVATESLIANKPPAVVGGTLIVLYDFVAENDGELTVEKGQSVTLLVPHDLSGDEEWHLVKRDEKDEGYVPANFLLTMPS